MPPTPTTIGRYEVIEELGSGGFGRVYKCRDGNRIVAIKVLRDDRLAPDAREHFLREAELARTVRHENVCPIEEVGLDGDRPYIVMPFVEGGTLAKWMCENSPPVTGVLELVRGLALGLAAVHAAGLVHRDMKPLNILVHGAQFLIADFGLAKPIDDTTTVAFKGTWRYMSPEQLAPGSPIRIGPPSDIFGLGVILYELLTGAHPFPCALPHPVAQALAVVQNEPRKPSQIRPDLERRLDALCLKALAKAPGNRYASAGAFADAIAAEIEARAAEEQRAELLAQAEDDFEWAERFFYGRGVPQDLARANELYERASAHGYAPARNHLDAERRKVERREAERRHAEHRARTDYHAAEKYRFGRGVEKDLVKALELYQRAADRGLPEAQAALGELYLRGDGVRCDPATAREWYELAATQGHTEAQFRLGELHENGEGGAQDYPKAREWYELAAAQGHVEARNALKRAEFGLDSRAAEWAQAWANYGRGERCFNAAWPFRDYAKAREWYELAAEKGYYPAHNKFGLMFYHGWGVPQSYAEARVRYERAANLGSAAAGYNLGVLYLNGRGVPQNLDRARKWFAWADESATESEDHRTQKAARAALDEIENGIVPFAPLAESNEARFSHGFYPARDPSFPRLRGFVVLALAASMFVAALSVGKLGASVGPALGVGASLAVAGIWLLLLYALKDCRRDSEQIGMWVFGCVSVAGFVGLVLWMASLTRHVDLSGAEFGVWLAAPVLASILLMSFAHSRWEGGALLGGAIVTCGALFLPAGELMTGMLVTGGVLYAVGIWLSGGLRLGHWQVIRQLG